MGGTTQKRFFYKPHVNERHNIYIYLHYTFCILSFIPSLDPHGKLPTPSKIHTKEYEGQSLSFHYCTTCKNRGMNILRIITVFFKLYFNIET